MPRQLGTGLAGSPRRAALAEPRAASTSLLSQRPTHPAHRPGRPRPRGPSWRRPAAVRVRNGRPDVPAGCLRAACRAGAACCRSLCCAAGTACLLGPCCSGRTPARDLFSLAAPGGVRGCWRCCVGVGWVQKRVWWSRFEWTGIVQVIPNDPKGWGKPQRWQHSSRGGGWRSL